MLLEIKYKPSFLRDFKKLPPDIQADTRQKLDLIKNSEEHEKLRVHKLRGKLSDFYSFSVTYSHRVIFSYESKNSIVLLAIGNHDIYK